MCALRPSGERDEDLLASQLFLPPGNEYVAQTHMYTLLRTRVDNHILCPDIDDDYLCKLQILKQDHYFFQSLSLPAGCREHLPQRQRLRGVSLPGQRANGSLFQSALCLWDSLQDLHPHLFFVRTGA